MTFLIALLLQGDPAAAALEAFQAEYRAKEASARAAAVATLAATQHEKVYARLARLLTIDDKEVRIAAAKGLGGCAAEKKTRPMAWLLGAIGPNAKEPAVLAAILEALGKLKQEAALPEIEKHFRSRQIAVGRAAIEAAAEIRSSRSVPALIALLKWLEDSAKEAPALDGGGNYGGKNLPGVGGGGVQDQDARERERALTPVVNKALQAITGASEAGREAWEAWYRETGGRGRPER